MKGRRTLFGAGVLSLCVLLMLTGCQRRENVPLPTMPTVEVSAVPSPPPSPAQRIEPVELEDFLEEVNERRRAIAEGQPIDLSLYMVDHPEQSHIYTEAELETLTTYRGEGEELDKEELLADVDSCLTLLKTTYGAYDYFGGDDVFVPLMENVKRTLEKLDAPTTADLENALASELAQVVRDGHFRVGTHALRDSFSQEMYYVPGLYFDDPAGRTEDYLKPTIGPDGRICYWYAALSHDGSDLPAALDGETLAWEKAGTIRSDGTVFKELEQDGVPVLVSRAMWAAAASPKEKQLKRLAACGGDYADAPLLVFDVMGNGGGDDSYIMDWFRGWTGQDVQRRIAFASRLSQLARYAMPRYVRAGEAGCWAVSAKKGSWIEREGVTFVLTDKGTASSGESAVEFFRTVENTLFVGGPTTGCALVPNNVAFYLPNSSLGLYFGTGLSMTEDAENRDGVGFLPDLWVEPLDARKAVFRLMEYYGLTQ